MNRFKRVVSSLLLLSFMFALTSCTSKVDPQEITTFADTYAKCISFLDADRIIENTLSVDDLSAVKLKDKLTLENYEYEQAAIKSEIAKSIKYTVITDTMVLGNNKATVQIDFDIVNYKAVFKEVVGYSEAYIQALKDTTEHQTITINVNLEKQQDGRWLATADSIDKLSELYTFLDTVFTFGPNTLDLVKATSWLFSLNREYKNAREIELDLWFTDDPEVNMYYMVNKDGTNVFKSQLMKSDDIIYRATYGRFQDAAFTEDGYIKPGKYKISIYREDDLLLAEQETTVTYDDSIKPSDVTETPKGATYSIKDASFASIKSLGWWDYDGTMVADGKYCSNTHTLAFSIELMSSSEDLYYAVYYVPGDKIDMKKIDYSKPVYEKTIDEFVYLDGTAFLNFDYEPETLEVASYVIVIAKDKSSLQTPYIQAFCKVISQTSEEFL